MSLARGSQAIVRTWIAQTSRGHRGREIAAGASSDGRWSIVVVFILVLRLLHRVTRSIHAHRSWLDQSWPRAVYMPPWPR